MRKMKDYAKPFLRIELFCPQDFVAVCEYYMDGIDPINNASITSSTKFWLDDGNDGVINGSDYYKHATNQTDGAGSGPIESLVKAWWAISNDKAEDIYNATDKMAVFRDYQEKGWAGYVDAVINPKNDHYYAGTIKFAKNNS